MPENQWYTNKDLFEQIVNLKTEMKETRTVIKKYNGLYQKVSEVQLALNVIQSQQEGKASVGTAIRNWGGWIFGLGSFIALILKTF